MKRCSRCGELREANTQNFPPRLTRTRDGLQSWCRPCYRVARVLRLQDPAVRQRDRIKARVSERLRRQRNAKPRQIVPPEVRRAKQRVWQNRANKKRRSTPEGKINGRMSASVWECLTKRKAGRSWESLVGYSLDQLMSHIQKQFKRGMSWENMGEWHIDHIVPLSSFSFETPDDPEFRAAWALTNLRPLWKLENMQKHAKRTLLL